MASELTDTGTSQGAESKTSVLITISTPGEETPICRLGRSEEILGDSTVQQLIQKVVSPNSLFSVGVPMSQLQAESPTALAIGELLSADCCEVTSKAVGDGGAQTVGLDDPVLAIANEQVGTQGNRFLNVTLDVHSSADRPAPTNEDRRELQLPETVEAERPAEEIEAIGEDARKGQIEQLSAALAAAAPAQEAGAPAEQQATPAEYEAQGEIVTIVAEQVKEEPKAAKPERAEYARKSDWLRAQFLPEVEALDFSGLFVGNLGLGARQEQARRSVVLSDPSRVTDILLQANGYRRSGDHAKALIQYQELVDIDPGNADFRFLLGKTLLELGQHDQAGEALLRAKELGHEGARKELVELRRSGHKGRKPLGFLRFWKQ